MIAATPERIWTIMTDPIRLPYWMRIAEDVSDVSGPLEEVSTNYRLEYGIGMHARIEILEAERPTRYVIRASAFGASEKAVVTLAAIDSGTAVRVEIEHRATLGAVGRLLEFLFRLRGYEWTDRASLRRLKALAERHVPEPEVGGVYSLDAGGMYRIARVIARDEGVVHLRLFAGVLKRRPEPGSSPDLRMNPMPSDAAAMDKAMSQSFRASMRQFRRGQPLLRMDGGSGHRHLPFDIEAFGDAEPELITSGPVEDDAAPLVDGENRCLAIAAIGIVAK